MVDKKMAKWITLRARFPDDEFEEIERIKEKLQVLNMQLEIL